MKLLFLPWICKPLYSPIISNTKSKKWWLILSISLLGLTCLMVSKSAMTGKAILPLDDSLQAGFLVSVDNLVAMSALLFVFNFLASAQVLIIGHRLPYYLKFVLRGTTYVYVCTSKSNNDRIYKQGWVT
jgi:hypothetical protein